MLLFISSPVYAKEIKVDYIDNLFSNRTNTNNSYTSKMGFILDDNRVIYCIEPFKWVGSNYEVKEPLNHFNKDDEDYIKLVANYVDDKVQKRNINYYVAAQELIWNRIEPNSEFHYSLLFENFEQYYDISSEKMEIDSFAYNFKLTPSFDNFHITGKMYETIELTDYNQVLSSFNIINETKNEVWSEGNTLYIKILTDEKGTIKFEKKIGRGDIKYYQSSNKQELADLTGEVVNTFYLNIDVIDAYYNDFRIEFIDEESNNLVESNISFNLNNINYSTTNGIYLEKNKSGNYIVDVISVPNEYEIPDKSSFTINKGDENNYVHKVYLKKKTTQKNNEEVVEMREDIKETKTHDEQIENSVNYCVLTNFKELPNTINYIKYLKLIAIIVIIIEILRHVKKIFKN